MNVSDHKTEQKVKISIGVPISQLMMMSMQGQDCFAGVLYLSVGNLTWAEGGWGAIFTALLMPECAQRHSPYTELHYSYNLKHTFKSVGFITGYKSTCSHLFIL